MPNDEKDVFTISGGEFAEITFKRKPKESAAVPPLAVPAVVQEPPKAPEPAPAPTPKPDLAPTATEVKPPVKVMEEKPMSKEEIEKAVADAVAKMRLEVEAKHSESLMAVKKENEAVIAKMKEKIDKREAEIAKLKTPAPMAVPTQTPQDETLTDEKAMEFLMKQDVGKLFAECAKRGLLDGNGRLN